MIKYTLAPLNLSDRQFHTLATGQGICVCHKNLSSQVGKGFQQDGIYLTNGQLRELEMQLEKTVKQDLQ